MPRKPGDFFQCAIAVLPHEEVATVRECGKESGVLCVHSIAETLELEFPVRAVTYAVRRGSGGAGRFHGGDGVIRELEALAELRYSLITERRRHPPPGAAGGAPGQPGRNLLDGEELPAKAIGTIRPGQRLRIETPGGGGHGPSAQCRDDDPGESPSCAR